MADMDIILAVNDDGCAAAHGAAIITVIAVAQLACTPSTVSKCQSGNCVTNDHESSPLIELPAKSVTSEVTITVKVEPTRKSSTGFTVTIFSWSS